MIAIGSWSRLPSWKAGGLKARETGWSPVMVKVTWLTIIYFNDNLIAIKGDEIRDTKNPQFVAQHCFVASFGRCFTFSPYLINLTRNKNICCGLKKCDALIGWFARARAKVLHDKLPTVSLMKNEQWQSQNLLLKVDPRSTFRNFLKSATNVFVTRQVDHARWKTGNSDRNLQRNNVARQVEGFCISYFAALIDLRIAELIA